MFTSISGRSVLVTGSTRASAKFMAAGFAAEGAKVVITGRDAGLGAATAAELTAAGGTVHYVRRHVSDPASCGAAVAAARRPAPADSTWCAATRASSRPRRSTR